MTKPKFTATTNKKDQGSNMVLYCLIGFLLIATALLLGLPQKLLGTGSTNTATASSAISADVAKDADAKINKIIESVTKEYDACQVYITSTASDDNLSDIMQKLTEYENKIASYNATLDNVQCEGITEYKRATSNLIYDMERSIFYTIEYMKTNDSNELTYMNEKIDATNDNLDEVVKWRARFLNSAGFAISTASQSNAN